MKNILDFLIKAGELKSVKRKGITFYNVKNPDSATDHAFRMALMVWIFGKQKRINMEKALKMALIHDICKVFTGDITPYDGLLPRNKKKKYDFVRCWRRLGENEKKKRHFNKVEKEYKAIKKLTAKLPPKLKDEIKTLWLDYSHLKSRESYFVHQIDVSENLIEAFECWKENKRFPTKPWWEHVDEVIDEPVLLEFAKELERIELKAGKE